MPDNSSKMCIEEIKRLQEEAANFFASLSKRCEHRHDWACVKYSGKITCTLSQCPVLKQQ